jgi:hypothetical protein
LRLPSSPMTFLTLSHLCLLCPTQLEYTLAADREACHHGHRTVAYDSGQVQPKSETAKDFDAAIAATLEISSYDLAVLKRHLIAQNWVPASTDEHEIDDAVFRFRKTYRPGRAHQVVRSDYHNIFKDNPRLSGLFNVWANGEIEDHQAEYEHDPMSLNATEIHRESAKYDAVRALLAHLAASKTYAEPTGSVAGLPDLTDVQAMELLKTNARLRAVFTNNVKKSTDKELKEIDRLKQKISEKDAEIAGMLRSLA